MSFMHHESSRRVESLELDRYLPDGPKSLRPRFSLKDRKAPSVDPPRMGEVGTAWPRGGGQTRRRGSAGVALHALLLPGSPAPVACGSAWAGTNGRGSPAMGLLRSWGRSKVPFWRYGHLQPSSGSSRALVLGGLKRALALFSSSRPATSAIWQLPTHQLHRALRASPGSISEGGTYRAAP